MTGPGHGLVSWGALIRPWLRALCLLPLLIATQPAEPVLAASYPISATAAQPSNATGAAVSGPNREIFGFATAGSLGDSTIGYPSWNFNLLSTVAFYAVRVNYNGVLIADSNWNVFDGPTFTNLVNTAHSHGVKVVVVLRNGFSDTVDFCDMLYNGSVTVQQIVNQVVLKGIDGVNIDYEGQLAQCSPTNPAFTAQSTQSLLTAFAKDMRAGLDAVHPGYYLSIDTYSGSAGGNDGFFNIPDLNQYVDSFFVMAYDMDYSNQGIGSLAGCAYFCMNPVSPLGGTYYWNDTNSMSQYVAAVGANKVILGQPYYGRVACVNSTGEHAHATSHIRAAGYLDAAAAITATDVKPGTYAVHRGDSYDPNGADRWDTWYDLTYNCWSEMYWPDATQLGTRYDLVNADNLRGVGFWTLNYGGGANELWNQISYYFTSCKGVNVSTSPVTKAGIGSSVTVTASALGCRNPTYHFGIMVPGSNAYVLAQDYSTSPTYTWNTSGLQPGTYRFSVWAEDANSPGTFKNWAGHWDAYNNNTFFTLSTCTGVNVSAQPATGAKIGSTVTFTASSVGCPNPNPQYHFGIMAPGSSTYATAQDYSTTASYSWATSGLQPGNYRLSVWVKDAASSGAQGNSFGRWDAYNNWFTYGLATCAGLNVTVAPPSPSAAGATVTVSASAVGCPNPGPLYHFGIMGPGAAGYTTVQDYSTASTYSWSTTGLVPGTYRFSVWAKDSASTGAQGNSFGRWDVYNNFVTDTLTGCSSVSVTVSPPSPSARGKTVTVTAHSTGCANPQFHFGLLSPGGTGYVTVQDYSSSNTYTWSTTGLAAGTYRFSVWVKDANSGGAQGNWAGRWDAYDNWQTYSLT